MKKLKVLLEIRLGIGLVLGFALVLAFLFSSNYPSG